MLSVDVKAEFCLPFVDIFKSFEMDYNDISLFELSCDDINAMKKKRPGGSNRKNEG